jgi:phosphocarrier protein HPr
VSDAQEYPNRMIEVEIVNMQGLHARPAHQVVLLANEFPCKILVKKGDLEVDAKSIMSLMMLAADKGSRLQIQAQGERADEALVALDELFASGFGED